ncbi:MAG TPA: hypothetical protein VMT18_15780, partial [Planctomycetota bacterium]|nr:hypothetical protein [Planctomycetota bacterium]
MHRTTHTTTGGGPLGLAAGLFVLGLLAPPGRAQVPEPEDNDVEAFAEVDPRTGGEGYERLGYVRVGPLVLPGPSTSEEVQQVLGGVPMLWVETEHFQLGSSLKTYRLQGDGDERDKLAAEFKALEAGLGRFKHPRSELDPWMRLHLAAQRLETIHAEFVDTFGLADVAFGPPAAGMGAGPHLGQKSKFLVLLLEKSGSLARYTRRFTGNEQLFSYRYGFTDGGYFFGLAAESLRQNGYALDATLHTTMAFGVVNNLCDGFRATWGAAPLWFKYGLGHVWSRRIDPRWNLYEGGSGHVDLRDDAWVWEPRIRGLVENGVYPSFEEMLAWQRWDEMKQRDHMMAWSRAAWLLERKQSDPHAFLMGVTQPAPEGQWDVPPELRAARQAAAFVSAFGGTPAE